MGDDAGEKGIKQQADNLRQKAADWSRDHERAPNSSIPDHLRKNADDIEENGRRAKEAARRHGRARS